MNATTITDEPSAMMDGPARKMWTPSREEFDAYKKREVEMAILNLRTVQGASHTNLHSPHTMLLAIAGSR